MSKHQQRRNTGGKLGVVVEQTGHEFKATISTFSNKVQRRQVSKQVHCNGNPSWQILPRTQNGRALPFGRCTVHARTDGLPLTALVCADHTIPRLSSLVSSGIKNTQGKLLQTLFQTLKLRSIQVAFRTSCGPDRKRNAAHEKSWTTKSWIHGGNLDAYRHMRESTLKDPKRKTLETVARPVAAKRLEKKQWAAHGLFGVTKPFCTMMVGAAL